MNIVKRMAEINARKAELRAQLEGSEKVDLDAIEKELRELNEEFNSLEKRQQTINGIKADEYLHELKADRNAESED